MYRWGNTEDGHSYIEGVYTDEEKALEKGLEERTRRDCKYEPQVTELMANEDLLCRRERLKLIKGSPSKAREEFLKKKKGPIV